MMKQVFSGKGISVAEADESRDKAFVSVKNFLWGYRQVSSAPHADKAKELYELIKGFKNRFFDIHQSFQLTKKHLNIRCFFTSNGYFYSLNFYRIFNFSLYSWGMYSN